MAEDLPKNLSEQMFPNPHIREAVDLAEPNPIAEVAYLALLNAQNDAYKAGADLSSLPLMIQYQEHAKTERENVTDPMTGLLNREGMARWMERYGPEDFGVIFADGRNFKSFNNVSYEVGDQVISIIGQEIGRKIRLRGRPDNVNPERRRQEPSASDAAAVMRYGGDEFIILVNFNAVPKEERQKSLDGIIERLSNFGRIVDEDRHIDLPIEVDVVGRIASKDEGKTIDDYRNELESELRKSKARNKQT